MIGRRPLEKFHGKACPYCGDPMHGNAPPTRDHVTPKWKGGTDMMVVCGVCNFDKGGKTLQQWAHKLQRTRDRRYERISALVTSMDLPRRPRGGRGS